MIICDEDNINIYMRRDHKLPKRQLIRHPVRCFEKDIMPVKVTSALLAEHVCFHIVSTLPSIDHIRGETYTSESSAHK